MTDIENHPPHPANANPQDAFEDEGGLRAPPHLHGWRKAWWWFDFIVLVKLARLRFLAILVIIGLVITQWDTLVAHYEKWTRPAVDAAEAGSDIEYFCPMHPSVIRDNAKEKCPICAMPLSRRRKSDAQDEALPAGVVNRMQLSPYRIALAGVQTWQVDYVPLAKEIKAVGYIEFNERGQRSVTARVAGRIDRLMANETGQMVRAGDELLLLYSPELLVTVQALLDAGRDGDRSFQDITRSRLRQLGIDDAQIEEILTAKKAPMHVRIRSPISGHVIKKYVREGEYVQAGSPLYDLADLSKVWVQAQLHEDDAAFLPARYEHGAPPTSGAALEVMATSPSVPNREFHGQLAFVYPHVDRESRTVTVRFEVENPGHVLRPGSTANITLKIPPADLTAMLGMPTDVADGQARESGRMLAIPETSVIDTGEQRIVYREASPGVFEGVLVTIGPRMIGADSGVFYPVITGLHAGDRIVTHGSFLVDAETRLNPAAGSIYFGSAGSTAKTTSTTVRPSTPTDADAKVQQALDKLAPEDRALVRAQQTCPVLDGSRLGAMGTPIKVILAGQPVFLCCPGCKDKALADPQKTLAAAKKLVEENKKHSAK
ncbi:MAG: efflux RND transporter periplasmic adaptor subunit [Planctomycetia bacterium]|nr:efflux RND transporter periplasmic adaptor subunit [Planctomycetia bacterium]